MSRLKTLRVWSKGIGNRREKPMTIHLDKKEVVIESGEDLRPAPVKLFDRFMAFSERRLWVGVLLSLGFWALLYAAIWYFAP